MAVETTVRRADAFEAQLSEEQRWKLYDRLRRSAWWAVAEWVEAEFSIPRPSRSALYAFKRHMDGLESAHRIETALSERENLRREMAEVGDMDPELQHAWLRLAQESSLNGDPKAGERFLRMARALRADATKRLEIQLKQQAEARAAAELEIAQRKLSVIESKVADARAALDAARGGKSVDPEKLADEIDRILGRAA
jgi:transposase-like protein